MSTTTILHDLTARCAEILPGRIRSAYLEGSGADETRIATSDLDGTIVFQDALPTDERATVARLIAEWSRATGIECDLELTDRDAVARGVSPALKEAGRLVWGDDIRAEMALLPLPEWTRDRLHTSYWRAVNLFGRTPPVHLPLAAPDPADPFLGYCRRAVRVADAMAPSTRDLVRHIGWAATGLLALRAGRYVARKRDCHRLYAALIGDEWSALLRDLYERCRGEWGYLLPDDEDGRAALHAICARALAFENHFMRLYRAFLLDELRGTDEIGRALAAQVLGKVPLAHAEVSEALAIVGENER